MEVEATIRHTLYPSPKTKTINIDKSSLESFIKRIKKIMKEYPAGYMEIALHWLE